MRQKSNHIGAQQSLGSPSSCRNLPRRWKPLACAWFPGGPVYLMVLALFRSDEGVWSGTVRRGLSGPGVWGNKGHGIARVDNSCTWLKAGCLDTAQGVHMQSSGCRELTSGSVHHSTSFKLTSKSPGGFVPSWHHICSHGGKFHHQKENEAVAAWILLGVISRPGCGNLLLESFALSGEAQLNTVLFLCCLSHASHVTPSVKAWWLLSVVRRVVQSLGVNLWSLRWTRQLVEGLSRLLGLDLWPSWALLSVRTTWHPLNQNSP